MLRPRTRIVLAASALWWIGGCDGRAEDGATKDKAALDAPLSAASAGAKRTVSDAAAGLSFVLPELGLEVSAEHYDASAPPQKIKHSVVLSSVAGTVLRIDVWDDPERLGLRAWFDKYLSFTSLSASTLDRTSVGLQQLPAIVVDQLRSPQSQARRIVVLEHAGRVFRITCLNSEDETARQVLQEVLDSFEPQVRP